ncbi:phage tail tape measure protein [Nocardioides sp. SYSU DS0663]|uniref:phage tail tape measure protein n=1 Tax=Nocardioides sp. SYSU DS0663 TaxID=3416445 RepID=UPI003F4B33C7
MTAQARSVVVRLTAETAQYIQQMQAAGKMTENAMTAAERSSTSASQAMDDLGNTAGKIGLAAAAGLGAIVLTTADFEKQMSAVQAATHETADNMGLLRDAAIDAGAETAFSASEAAAGIENLAKAGVETQEILGGGLAGALDLAAAGEMEVADAAEAAAGAMAQFSLEGEQVPHIADLLAAAAGKAQGDVSDMVMALKQAGTVSAQTGLTLEETTGALAAMAEQSLLGSDAGTSFKTMLAALTPNSEKAASAMEQYNIHAFDAQGNFVGMTQLAGQLERGLGHLTDEQRAMALETIFGSDAVRAAAIIYDNGAAGIEKWTNQVNDSGYAAETAGIRLDNLAGDWEEFTGSLETALIGAGTDSQGFLRDLVQGATTAVNIFNDMPPAMQGVVTKLLAITAILGGGAWFGSKVVRGVADTRAALDALGGTSRTAATDLDGLGESGKRAGSRLATIAKTAVGIAAVGMAVGALADGIGRIDSANLDRALEALGRGEVVGDVEQVVENLKDLTSWTNAIDAGEAVTLFGLFGDSTLDKYADNVEQVDQALAQLVETGEEAQALELFEQLVADAGLSAEESAKYFDAYALAVRNAEGATGEMLGILDGISGGLLADELGGTADAAEDLGASTGGAAGGVDQMTEALRESRKAAGEAAMEFFNLGEGLNDADVSLDGWISQLEEQADALENFRRNAIKAAEEGVRGGLVRALQEAGPEGAMRLRQLANASDAEIERANRAWRRGEREINRYTDAVGGVPDADLDVDASKAARMLERLEGQLDDYGLTTETADAALRDVASGKIKTVQGLIDTYGLTKAQALALLNDQASGAIRGVRAELAALDGDTATTYIKTVRSITDFVYGKKAAGGPIVGPGTKTSDSVPILASDGEFMMSAAAVDHYGLDTMFAMNARRLADGGPTTGPRVGWMGPASSTDGDRRSLEDQLAIAEMMRQLRDLRRSLNADGKDRLKGIDRRIANLQLEAAEKELRLLRKREQREDRQAAREKANALREVGSGFSLDGLVPDDRPTTVAGGMRAEINQFRADVVDAGGNWTRALRDWAKDMMGAARELDRTNAAIARETEQREQLVESLAEQQRELDDLNRTMASYADSVANQFLSNPFDGSRTETVAGTPDAGLVAGLSTAEARLVELRSSSTGDSVAAAAEASRLIGEIAEMRAAVEAQSQPIEKTVTGLAALEETLLADTAAAEAMTEALALLEEKGLDTTGALGGLYQQLAASGDFATASELAALSEAQVDYYEQLFAAREGSAAVVAAQATQAVYGQQHAELTGLIDVTNDALAVVDATLTVLNAQAAILGQQVRDGAADGIRALEPQIRQLTAAVRAIPRKQAENNRKGKP